MAYLTINLADTNSIAGCWPVPPGATKAAIMIQAATWGTAVVTLQWNSEGASPDNPSYARPAFLDTPFTFTTSINGRANVSVSGKPFIRLRTTTASSGATANAAVYVSFA